VLEPKFAQKKTQKLLQNSENKTNIRRKRLKYKKYCRLLDKNEDDLYGHVIIVLCR
jgi:hypothetical protein